jgi:hypothetical protein
MFIQIFLFTCKSTTMKLKFTYFLMLIVALFNFFPSVYAKVWRVNNASNYNGTTLWGDNLGGTQSNPVFKQLQQANDANSVNQGDTIHVEGAVNVYNNADISKRLILIGPGYFLNENPNTSNALLEAVFSQITFNQSSNASGSSLMGFCLTGFRGVWISQGINSITILRCKIDGEIFVGHNNMDIFVLQNYFTNIQNPAGGVIFRNSNGFPSNFIFNNNIVRGVILLTAGNSSGAAIYSAAEIKNNIFDCPTIAGGPSILLNTGSFQNNILKNPAAAANVNNNNSVNVSFNVSSSTNNQFGTANNNLVVANINSIFVDPVTNTTDGDYQLLSSWATANPGSDGAARGAFGGASPTRRYTLSGLAAIPVIYDINTSGVAAPTGLQVTIKARVIQ